MKEAYGYMDYDEAIEKIQKLKKKNKNGKIFICTVNFDKDEYSQKVTTPEEGYLLVKKSKTIIMNEDTIIPHMQLFSKEQVLENIIRRGTMHDIIFGG